MLLGVVGLILPIIPQIPFLVAGMIFLMLGSRRFSKWIRSNGFYREHVEVHIKKIKFLAEILYKDEGVEKREAETMDEGGEKHETGANDKDNKETKIRGG